MSMYKGKRRFDREQLVFMIEAAMVVALDRVGNSIPPCPDDVESYQAIEENLYNYRCGILEFVGTLVPTLWVHTEGKLTGDSYGSSDFCMGEAWKTFEDQIQEFISEGMKGNEPKYPEFRDLAEKIVDDLWWDYLQPELRYEDRALYDHNDVLLGEFDEETFVPSKALLNMSEKIQAMVHRQAKRIVLD